MKISYQNLENSSLHGSIYSNVPILISTICPESKYWNIFILLLLEIGRGYVILGLNSCSYLVFSPLFFLKSDSNIHIFQKTPNICLL